MIVVYAAISLLMLVGFWALAAALLAGAVLLAKWLADLAGEWVALPVPLPLFAAVVGSAGYATVRALGTRSWEPRGITVGPDQAPELWELVHEVARSVDTKPPHEIYLVHKPGASVYEHTSMLGVIGGRRLLALGLPLVTVFSVDQLRAVVAHELGHYSRAHTRLGDITYRCRTSVVSTVRRISVYNPVGWVFGLYALLYLAVDLAFSRRKEYQADRAAAQVAGRAAAASAIRETFVLGQALETFYDEYVRTGWELGYVPESMYLGLPEMVSARHAEYAEIRADELDDRGGGFRSHPPMRDRIAAIAAMPEVRHEPDCRPAAVLFDAIDDLARRLQEVIVDADGRTVLPWPEFSDAVATAKVMRKTDAILRVVGRHFGIPNAHGGSVLSLLADGKRAELAELLFEEEEPDERISLLTDSVERLLQLAAVRTGAGRWQHSWSGPAELEPASGGELPLAEIAKLATSDNGVPEALRRLDDLAIDPTRATVGDPLADARGAEALTAVSNVLVDEVEHDLVVTTDGLVFVGDPGETYEGKKRLKELAWERPMSELAALHRFVSYGQIAEMRVVQEVPFRLRLTLYDGRELLLEERWTSETLTRGSTETLLAAVSAREWLSVF